MRLTIQAADLHAVLEVASAATDARRSVLPVLGCVLLEAGPDQRLLAVGTDLERRAWHAAPAEVAQPGALAVAPKPLAELLAAVGEREQVQLTVEGARVTATAGQATVRLAGLPAEEFPAGVDFTTPAAEVSLPGAALASALGAVEHAAARDMSRPVLAGVELVVADGWLAITAADGFRLAHRRVPVAAESRLAVIVPARALGAAVKLAHLAEVARLATDAAGRAMLVESSAGAWSIPVIAEQFPDWRRIVPQDSPVRLRVASAELLRALGLARSVPTEMARLEIQADGLVVRAVDGDQEATMSVAAELLAGGPGRIALNRRYLAEAAAALDAEAVVLAMSGPARPVLLTADGDEAGLQVVMPMHVER